MRMGSVPGSGPGRPRGRASAFSVLPNCLILTRLALVMRKAERGLRSRGGGRAGLGVLGQQEPEAAPLP